MQNHIQVIEINQEGKFIKEDAKYFMIMLNKPIRFVYQGNLKINDTMYLLTNLHNDYNKKTVIKDVRELQQISIEQFKNNYNYLQGNFEEQLLWSTEVIFDDPGQFTFQLVILKNEKKEKCDQQIISNQSLDQIEFYQHFNRFRVCKEINKILVATNYYNQIRNTKYLSHDFLNVITLFPAMLGPFETWEFKLQNLFDRGYRGFHFTPIQNLGPSNSAYCIQDFQKLNKNVFKNDQNIFILLKQFFDNFKKNYDCFFMVDILFNHCSIDCEQILNNKDATFNSLNTPELNIACLLDKELQLYNNILIQQDAYINKQSDIDEILNHVKSQIFPKLKIEQYFQLDIDQILNDLMQYFKDVKGQQFVDNIKNKNQGINFVNKQNFQGIENCFYNYGAGPYKVKCNIEQFAYKIQQTFYYLNILEIKKILDEINKNYLSKVENWKKDIINSLNGSIKYHFLELKNHKVTKQNKIAHQYFLEYKNIYIAKNGWIMNYNQENDFILHKDQFYLRRQIVIWEDLIKIRYINQSETSFIWKYMKDYTVQMAKIFDGFRFDNFHNSDINSAQYFIKEAYKVNQNLFNISEIFTPNEKQLTKLCEQACVHRMVQEVKTFEDPKQLDITLERNSKQMLNYYNLINQQTNKYLTPLKKAIYPKKIFYDQTHDNQTLYQKDKIRVQLPLLAVISFIGEMTGTTFGFDEMLTEQIHVTCQDEYPIIKNNIVEICKEDNHVLFMIEKKDFEYQINENIFQIEIKGSFNNWQQGHVMRYSDNDSYWDWINLKFGVYQYKFVVNNKFWTINKNQKIIKDDKGNFNNVIQVQKNDLKIHENFIDFRKYFNDIHEQQKKGYKIQIQHKEKDIFFIRRYTLNFQKCQKLIARYNTQKSHSKNFNIEVQGDISSIEKIGFIDQNFEVIDKQTKFPRLKAKIYETQNIQHFACIQKTENKNNTLLSFKNIPDNFICMINCQYSEEIGQAIDYIKKELNQESGFLTQIHCYIDLQDINYFLYSCENEEIQNYNRKTFYVPNYGKLVFAGFSGLKNILVETAIDINKNHPVFNMILQNDYLIDYYIERVQSYNLLKFDNFKQIFCEICEKLKQLPRFLIPPYFQRLILQVIEFFEDKFLEMIQIRDGLKKNIFFQNLILSIPQFLTKHSNNLYLASAGLPHFSVGIWKNWGRDTFISFKGTFLVTKLFDQGKQILLHYAKYIRHGLIPNLLEPSRFNARDATWWYIKAVKDYLEATNDYKILQKKIELIYLDDDQKIHQELLQKNVQKKIQFIDLLQMIFQKHAEGIRFKEWNAPHIDDHMLEIGFNINLYVDWNIGFIFGGNAYNCLTWMDKMGSSQKAQNKGHPGSSRFGAPIELTSLLYLGLKFMNMLYEEGFSQFIGVNTNYDKQISYKQWKQLLQQNFQKYYWIPNNIQEFQDYKIEEAFVFRKGILKDCFSNNKHDYMLRPNALIAIAITPKLIDNDKAISYVNQVTKLLLKKNSIGVKTLDPSEDCYYSNYNNSDDSSNYNIAHGFNYHNGPEWVWLYGYYLMAINRLEERCTDITLKQINRIRNHLNVIQNNNWLSLPELTNDNGQFCQDSCQSQLWSIACLLQAFGCGYEQLNIKNLQNVIF